MAANVYVGVSGPALSFLLYENVKSASDQKGFLLGEVVSHVTDTISDSQIRGEKTETQISVNSLMPIPNSVELCNGIGIVSRDKLKEFLKEKEKVLVGWYRFRRNSVLTPHLRDKLLHKQLCSSLSHLSSEHFTLCLLNTSVSAQGSTHIFNHKFIRYRHRMFESLPVQIHNLGEAPQTEYKLVPSKACLSDSFNSIISSLTAAHEKGSDASLVCNIQRALQEHMKNLISDIEHSERRISELEREIVTLRLHPGLISDEIVLPQMLQEEISTAGNSSSGINNKNPSVSDVFSVVAPKLGKNQSICNDAVEYNQSRVVAKEEASSDYNNSSDAFAFVTEMKIQMSQPQNATSSPSTENFCAGSNKQRPGGHGRGGGRGLGRAVRKSKVTDVSDNSPNVRRGLQSEASDSPSSTAVRGASQNMNNVNTKPRGYAQAVKRSLVAGDGMVTKSPAMSQATSTNGSPSSSNSQKY
ncbi:BRCA1-A complex subunit Abraxas [Zootermopsis nevadensis]|uniref:BRCA1-A complex subunit Abraxas n=1 Tax=Zootermopsis nevadensis TaxID=136037 RepID=A0A067QPN2_ZOONE|nr:BRCA1-A complex subunit Abraxas [Zootermopsis nevadensis]